MFMETLENFLIKIGLGIVLKIYYKITKKKISKEKAIILFIDDEEFPIVDSLREGNWTVERIKDILSVEDEKIKKSHVIFVDNKGVGQKLSPREEGLGVIKAIKSHYGNKKRVVLYSSYAIKLGKDLHAFDAQLLKSSPLYEFETMIFAQLDKL